MFNHFPITSKAILNIAKLPPNHPMKLAVHEKVMDPAWATTPKMLKQKKLWYKKCGAAIDNYLGVKRDKKTYKIIRKVSKRIFKLPLS